MFLVGIPLDTELIEPLCAAIPFVYMNIQFILNVDLMLSIYFHLSNEEDFQFPPDFVEIRDKTNRRVMLFSFSMFMICTFYGVIHIFIKNSCDTLKKATNTELSCGIFVPTILPFDMNFFPLLQVLYLAEQLSTYHIFVGGCCLVALVYEIVTYIGNRMNHLCLILEGIPNEKDVKIQKEIMKLCIRYHQDIIR